MTLEPVEPILATELIPQVDAKLVELLRGLSEEQWRSPTVCREWCVKDIAAHLLDGNVRRLSLDRDRMPAPEPSEPIRSYTGLVRFLNGLNADWVKAAQRISPRLLVDLIDSTGREVVEYFRTLDPFAEASFPVSWAGHDRSPAWFDIAREYTEKWHHQQQIRDAVGAPGLFGREFLYPVLDTFLRALPHTFRDAPGAVVTVEITGEAGGSWTVREKTLFSGAPDSPDAWVRLDADTAWRLFTKGLTAQDASVRVQIEGDVALGSRVLEVVAVMA